MYYNVLTFKIVICALCVFTFSRFFFVIFQMQWQNNDKHKPKHDSGPQDVLQLRPGQVEKILDLALAEASKEPMEEKRLQILKSRVPLIVSCLDTTEKAQKAMEYLQGMNTNMISLFRNDKTKC